MLHLLPPAAVHFSVAFLVAGGLGESFGILLRRPGIERWSGTLVLLGTLSLFPTVVTGFLAENVLRPSEDLASRRIARSTGRRLSGWSRRPASP